MNILILISSLSFGGAEKQAVLDANMLSRNNKVYLGFFRTGPLKNQINSDVSCVLFDKGNYIKTAYDIALFVKKHKISIIHASLFAPMSIAALTSIITNVNVIWHFHSHEYDIPLKSKLSFKYLSQFPKVKKILFVNQELKDYFQKRFSLSAKKTGILYNSSNFQQTNIEEISINSCVSIGYLGRLVKLKRVHYLINLAAFLKKNNCNNFTIDIVGDGTEKQNLIDYAEEIQVSDNVIFHGFQSDIEKYYESFDIFINPSEEECLSIALIDAGMKSLPSIAFDVGGNSDIIVNNKSGYIVNNQGELFNKALQLCEDITLRKQFGEQANQYCNRQFSEHVHLIKLTDIYKNCL